MNLVIYFVAILLLNIKTIISVLCPDECKCRNKGKDVICVKKGLKLIPKSMPAYVEILDLGFNDFHNLSGKVFNSFKKLRILHLDHCQIKNIDLHAFDGLSNLKFLFLTNNNINGLHQDLLMELRSLQRLYLGNNQFQMVPALGSSSLIRLNLDGNKISSANIPKSFKMNTNLKTLKLTKNHITSVNSSDFANLANTRLETLILKMNNIGDIDANAFKPIKDSLKTLELEGNSLLTSEKIEVALRVFDGASQILYLDLRQTGLTFISKIFFKPFKDSKLHRINIGSNPQLSKIDRDAFHDLVNVEELVSDKCEISSETIRFNALTSLKKINLSHNKFSTCPQFLPESLHIIDLSFNKLNRILASDLRGLSSLTDLNLANNEISSIDADSFSSLALLKSLDLNHNQLEVIQPHLFYSMNALTKLDLHQQHPCLKQISAGSFSLSNLLELSLSGNCINVSTTDYPVFNGCPNLSHLSMASNTIEYLPKKTFIGCRHLSYLDLSHNKIKGWSSAAFIAIKTTLIRLDISSNELRAISTTENDDNFLPMVFNKLHNVSLENNRWNCTCDSVKWIVGHRGFLHNSDKIMCSDPIERSGRRLMDIRELMDCPVESIKRGLISEGYSGIKVFMRAVLPILASIIIGIVIYYVRRKCRRLTRGNPRSYQNLLESTPDIFEADNGHVHDYSYNRLVIDDAVMNPSYNSVPDPTTDWLDKLRKRDFDCNSADIVFLSTESCVTERLTVLQLKNFETESSQIAAYHCEFLVIEYNFECNDNLEILVNSRVMRSKSTHVFHTIDVDISDGHRICTIVGATRVIRYDPANIEDAFYTCFNG